MKGRPSTNSTTAAIPRMNTRNKWITVLLIAISAAAVWAAANGSLSGTLEDPSGAVVPGAKITLLNSTLKTQFMAISDGQGFFCLSLSQPRAVAPSSPTCGPFAEDAVITSSAGLVYRGTRVGLGPDYGENTAQETVANSNTTRCKQTLATLANAPVFYSATPIANPLIRARILGNSSIRWNSGEPAPSLLSI
jgi:hypothetical protein